MKKFAFTLLPLVLSLLVVATGCASPGRQGEPAEDPGEAASSVSGTSAFPDTSAFPGTPAVSDTGIPADSTQGDSSFDASAGQGAATSDAVQSGVAGKVDLGGKRIEILAMSDSTYPDVSDGAISGGLIEDAAAVSRLSAEDALRVVLEIKRKPGSGSAATSFVYSATTAFAAGEPSDIYAAGQSAAVKLVLAGVCADLGEIEPFDMSAQWWASAIFEDLNIGGRRYLATGDLSAGFLASMYTVFCNQTLLADLRIGSPLSLVAGGEWTLDRMIETSVSAKTAGGSEIWGFTAGSHAYLDAFMFASDIRILEFDDRGSLLLTDAFNGEKMSNLAEKVYGFLNGGSCQVGSSLIFSGGRSLFTVRPFGRSSDEDFVSEFLPMPKFDVNQQAYVTLLGNDYTLYAISGSDSGESVAVLEKLASEGSQRILPAVFESGVHFKYREDTAEAEVMALVRASVRFDAGIVFADEFVGNTNLIFRSCVSDTAGYKSVAVRFNAVKRAFEKSVSTVSSNLAVLG